MSSSRLASLFLSSSLFSMAALSGCAEQGVTPIEHDASFAHATSKQIERVYAASSGLDLVQALLIADDLSGRNDPTACPAIVTKGTVTTVTGGCDTEEGRIEGSIVIRDMPDIHDLPSDVPTEPGSIEFDIRGTTSDGDFSALEGRVELDPDSGIRGDFTLTFEGVTSTSRLELLFGIEEPVRVLAGSEMAHSELGGAGVEGTWRFDESSGRLVVRGADELVFDFARRTDDGCVPYAAGENFGMVCDTLIEERGAARLDKAQVLAEPRAPQWWRKLRAAKR